MISSISSGELPDCCQVQIGTLADLPEHECFDTILYMDVLEHIADDRGELALAAAHLKPGGHIVVLAPAHQWLFTPFDEFQGHFRRYIRQTLRAAAPVELALVRLDYLDSMGIFASLGNRLVLKRAIPTAGQIALWDRVMVPLSTVIDRLFGHRLGKSVLGVWRKAA